MKTRKIDLDKIVFEFYGPTIVEFQLYGDRKAWHAKTWNQFDNFPKETNLNGVILPNEFPTLELAIKLANELPMDLPSRIE